MKEWSCSLLHGHGYVLHAKSDAPVGPDRVPGKYSPGALWDSILELRLVPVVSRTPELEVLGGALSSLRAFVQVMELDVPP